MTIANTASNVVLESTSFVNTLENHNTDSSVTITNSGYVCESIGDGSSKVTASTGAIKVYTFDQLQSLALASSDNDYNFAGKIIQLQNDIDMTGKAWIPFGLSTSSWYSGEIDGNGKTIKGLSYSENISSRIQTFASTTKQGTPFGLIAFAGENVNIHDLTVEASISMEEGLGVSPFIGVYNNLVSTSNVYELTFKNCTSIGTISAKSKVGGFVGTGFITYGSNFAQQYIPSGKRAKNFITFDNCTNNADLTATDTSGAKVGGFASCLPVFTQASNENWGDSTLTIKNGCVNTGKLAYSNTNYHGAFCGYLSGSGTYTIDGSEFSTTTNEQDVYIATNTLVWSDNASEA